ncbi:hypothetical protein STCU_03624 [Strigomonas culicis]|uniref:Uncharacterized protein n=1 Tax=Strigomonas culicis TaxID=28005 RepID=S9UJY2_9TRYP|nr:hypothetical protein STCU_03624 [Strigomonas culicis]|eukprot:EPY31097.1 hypothetical protein STCU_03624 [Strigomonas culicis]
MKRLLSFQVGLREAPNAGLLFRTPVPARSPALVLTPASSTAAPAPAIAFQRRGLRNLHMYPKARHKSLVKDTTRFARNWWLTAGNNHELVEEWGHEREATENFGVLRDDSRNDRYILSTNRLADLPANERLNALTQIMEQRWKVKDNNRGFDKAKLLLEALECFSEMRRLQQVAVFDALPQPDQDTFLQYVEGCGRFAQACSHSHPEATAVLIRVAQICDDMRCIDKRDEMLHMAEVATRRMGRAYAFARPHEGARLNPPTLSDVANEHRLKDEAKMAARFRNNPSVLEKRERQQKIYYTRGKFQRMTEMNTHDVHRRMLSEPARPERDSWSSS